MSREMKESGIEWVGTIPANWTVTRNKACFTCGKAIIGADSEKTQLLSLTTHGVVKKSTEVLSGKLPESFDTYQVVEENNLVMCLFDLDFSAVFSGVSRYNGMISPAYKVLSCRKNMLPLFADRWFAFVFDDRKFVHYAKNLRYTLNYNEFADLPIIVPPIAEQERISQFLSKECERIDKVIHETKSSISEYKVLKQAVITQAVTEGIHGSRSMVKSEHEWIGEYPAEWSQIKIKWLLNERKERSIHGEEEPLSMSQKFGLIPTKAMDRVPNMASSFVGAKLVSVGDLVFNKLKAHLGVFAVSGYDGLVSPDYAVYSTTGVANLKYLEYLFKTPQYISEFRKKSSGVGAGLTRLYTDDLYSIYCALPPLDEQLEIVDYLTEQCVEMDKLIAKKEQFLGELEKYKKSLIYEYVTGKKEVPWDN